MAPNKKNIWQITARFVHEGLYSKSYFSSISLQFSCFFLYTSPVQSFKKAL